MKGFLIFFMITLVILGGFIWYFVNHPSHTTMVRNGANWVIMEQNASEIDRKRHQ